MKFRSRHGDNGRLWELLVAGDSKTLSYVESRRDPRDTFIAPYLVVALEAARPTAPPAQHSLVEVDEVRIGRGGGGFERLAEGARAILRIEVPDDWMSSNHAVLSREDGGWWVCDQGSKNGTFVNGVGRARLRLADGDVIEIGGTLLLFRDQVVRRVTEPAALSAADFDGGQPALATLSPPLARDLAALRRIAGSALPVILLGESGTGKEMTARAVHALSGRTGAFVAINCGALPHDLVESELFGHRKGAFSGASEDRRGLVRAADGGTLLLDEVGELPEAAQIKLLRVLQEREVLPLGDTRPRPVDLRVVAATHQDLAQAVADSRFRHDLYARLAGFQMTLPPLRQRREDIGLLVRALLGQIAGRQAPAVKLRRSAARALFCYAWPLNIRELGQALAAAYTLAAGDDIGLEHLPPPIRHAVDPPPAAAGDEARLRARLEAALRQHGGNVSAVARQMGKARVQIRRWCKRLELDPENYRR